MAVGLGFLLPVPLNTQRTHVRTSQTTTTHCVLDKPQVKTTVKRSAAPKYQRLSEDDDRSHLIEPANHRSIPYIGETLEGILNLSTSISRSDRYDKVYRSNFSIYGADVVYISDFQSILEITRDNDNFGTHRVVPAFNDIFDDNIMIHLEPPRHKYVRDMVAPAFSYGAMQYYFQEVNAGSVKLLSNIEQLVKEKGKAAIAMAIENHQFDTVVNITSGIRDAEFVERMKSRFSYLLTHFLTPLIIFTRKSAEKVRRDMLDEFSGIIRKVLVERADFIDELRTTEEDVKFWASREIKKGDIDMSLIILAQSSLKTGPNQDLDPAIIDQVANLTMFMWAAGYGTSSSALTSAIFEVGRDKAIYEVLREEQDAIVRRAGGVRKVTYQQIEKEMPLLDSYLLEIVRMYPSAAGVMRRPRTDIEVAGRYIKANTRIYLDFWAACRDPNEYPNPNSIDLERHIQKPGKKVAKTIGFGVPGSPHYCIGAGLAKMFLKSTLSTMLREYDFEIDPNQKDVYGLFPDVYPRSGCIVQKLERRFSDS